MPKVHHVKARKDYPEDGVAKGEMCYVWTLKTGPRSSRKYRSKERPKQSQLTTSEFFQAIYSAQEDADEHPPESWDDFDSVLQSIKDRLEEIRSETEDKYNNLPEGFQNGSSGERLQGRVDAVQELIDELDNIDTSWEDDFDEDNNAKADDESAEDYEARLEQEAAERAEEALNERWSEVTDAFSNLSCD